MYAHLGNFCINWVSLVLRRHILGWSVLVLPMPVDNFFRILLYTITAVTLVPKLVASSSFFRFQLFLFTLYQVLLVTSRPKNAIRLIRYLVQLVNDRRVGKEVIFLDFCAVSHVDLEVKFGYELILTTNEILYNINDGQFAVRVLLKMQKRDIRDKVWLKNPLVNFRLGRFQVEGILKIISIIKPQVRKTSLFGLHSRDALVVIGFMDL